MLPLSTPTTLNLQTMQASFIAALPLPTCAAASLTICHRIWQSRLQPPTRPVEIPLATDNRLENTDGALHQRSLTPRRGLGGRGTLSYQCSLREAACYLLFMLTRAVLMPSLFRSSSPSNGPAECPCLYTAAEGRTGRHPWSHTTCCALGWSPAAKLRWRSSGKAGRERLKMNGLKSRSSIWHEHRLRID